MTAFSVPAPCGAGKFCLFGIDRDDLEIGAHDEEIELASSSFALPALEEISSFKHARG